MTTTSATTAIIRSAAGTDVPPTPAGDVFGQQAHQGYWDFVLGNEFDIYQAKEDGYLYGWELGAQS